MLGNRQRLDLVSRQNGQKQQDLDEKLKYIIDRLSQLAGGFEELNILTQKENEKTRAYINEKF